MKNTNHLSLIQAIIRDSGIVVMNSPSVHYPIPVSVFYRNNRDGSVGSLWPKGNLRADTSTFNNGVLSHKKQTSIVQRLFFALGLESLFAHGRLILYADVPTATFLQTQWRRN